jgi:uncharacterized protein YegP (UPF0339 family)
VLHAGEVVSARQPRFEICRGDDGWWARFRAANGRVVWVTETYERRRAALASIKVIARAFDHMAQVMSDRGETVVWVGLKHVEVREVDER